MTLPADETLVDVLERAASRDANRVAYTFLADGDRDERHLTYGALDARARAIAAYLQDRGAAGGRVLILHPFELDYIAALLGCFYAGAVAVPVHVPNLAKPGRFTTRLQAIARDSRASCAITSSKVVETIRSSAEAVAGADALGWIASEEIEPAWADAWRRPHLTSERIAFLQYTSGSTATPKGVMVSHGNVMHNERVIQTACSHDDESTFVGWLPLYHDMGLIGNVMQPLVIGARAVLMPPAAFLRNPFLWLQAISRYRGHTSGGPNFAYDLCAARVRPEQRAELDLSSWRVAFNGAEPIREDTLRRFAEIFAPHGFRWDAFFPCYGLAESTLMASGCRRPGSVRALTLDRLALEQHAVAPVPVERVEREPAACRVVTSSGIARLDQTIRIVDPVTQQLCPDDRVGEIWLGGPSIAQGYWDRLHETAETFVAPGWTDECPRYLRTGDLGFMHEGELFVTGRLKDIVIIRGRNLYPQDVERTAEQAHPDLRPGASAAFTIDVGGEEALAIVQEIDRASRTAPADLIAAIRQAVIEEHGVQPHAVVLIRQGTILKTTSGKIQRRACREQYLTGTLDIVAHGTMPSPAVSGAAGAVTAIAAAPPDLRDAVIDAQVMARIAQAVGVDAASLDMTRPLASFGLDSLRSMELQAALEADFGVTLDAVESLHTCTPRELIALVSTRTSASTNASAAASADAPRPSPLPSSLVPSSSPQPSSTQSSSPQPLTYGQRALWWLMSVNPTSSAYHLARAYTGDATLDDAALQTAVLELSRRHACLRTTFSIANGEPMAVVATEPWADVESLDVGALPEHERRALYQAAAHGPFEWDRRAPFRVRIFHVTSAERVVVIAIHHIIADLRSLDTLTRELGELYAAACAGRAVAPFADASLARQDYSDFAAWQTRWLQSAEGQRALVWWGHELQDAPRRIALPADRTRRASTASRGAVEHMAIGASAASALAALARRKDMTLFNVMLAAFSAFLHQVSAQGDLTIGCPVTGRPSTALGGVIGYFVNMLTLRSRLSGDCRFVDHLDRTRMVMGEALRHQHCPYPAVLEATGADGLFDTVFVWQQASPTKGDLIGSALGLPGAALTLGPTTLALLPLPAADTPFDLMLMMGERGGELAGAWTYDADLFDASTVRRFAEQFRVFVEGIAARPEAPLHDVPLSNARGAANLLAVRDNVSVPSALAGGLVPDVIARRAAETPDAIALVCGDEVLMYRTLEERANQVAHYLRNRGVRAETRVAVCLERSARTTMALLGVWKAGAAFVPLDPAEPIERRRTILIDSGAAVLLTQASLNDRVDDIAIERILLDEHWPAIARESTRSPGPVCGPKNVAYGIYTSGSTGRPKGVLVEHGALLHLLTAIHAEIYWTLGPRLAVGLNAPLTFDVSMQQFLALAHGHTVHVLPESLRRQADAMLDYVRRFRLDILDGTPSQLQLLVELGLGQQPDDPTLFIGGESVPDGLWQTLSASPSRDSYNMYGPTECTVYATTCPVRATRRPSIGAPLANTSLAVMDDWGAPLPVGVTGEIYLGGASVGRGYSNAPRLTAERFLPDPFGPPGARWFRTGDIGRRTADGRVDMLGRRDGQVKIRGFRVELGEIESAVRRQPGVLDVIVMLRGGATGKRLVCYVVFAEGEATTAAELRRGLRDLLPDYMVPAAFVPIDSVPMTANGKRDYARLPEPPGGAPREGGIAPRTTLEMWLAQLWAETLLVEYVNVDDDFFALGGHSLQAMRLVARVQRVFPTEVPLVMSFFQNPTIAAMTQALFDGVQGEANRARVDRILEQIAATPIAISCGLLETATPRLSAGVREPSERKRIHQPQDHTP